MRNHFVLLLTLITLLSSSCKKDKEETEETNICTESRDLWLDGSAGSFTFVTSQPCGILGLREVIAGSNIPQTVQPRYPVIFTNVQAIWDSAKRGEIIWAIAAEISDSLLDIHSTPTDTSVSITASNICKAMKTGRHKQYLNEAIANNTNAYSFTYTDQSGSSWNTVLDTSSYFNITSIDGIISQSPFAGAYFPYCVCRFEYNVLLQKQSAMDTIRLEGTGRLGFR